MGFRCPICHKDFGTNKTEMEKCLESHSDNNIIKDLTRLNFNDIILSASGAEICGKSEDILRDSQYD